MMQRIKFYLKPLVNEILDQLPPDMFTSPDTTFLDPALGGGQFLREVIKRLRAEGHSDDNIRSRIWGCEIRELRLKYAVRFGGVISDHLITTDFLSYDWGNMKFDVILGNPPYGKNSNLAVEFLNKSGLLAPRVCFVLPRTFRKTSILNRIDPYMHLRVDHTVPDHMFPAPILTCYQVWEKSNDLRAKIATKTAHPDFEFVTPDVANVCIGRVGAGPCGNIYLDDFQDRSVNSHYFIKTKNKTVLKKLQSLSPHFRNAGTQTVGVPSLSKDELIKIYEQGNDLRESKA